MKTFLLVLAGFLVGAALTFGGLYLLGYIDGSAEQAENTQVMEAEPEAAEQQELSEVFFTNLYRGNGELNKYAVEPDEAAAFLITNKTDFADIWQEIFEGQLQAPLPDLDFGEQSVVVVMSDTKTSTGHLVTLNAISKETNGDLTVNLEDKQPGEGCRTRDITTRPIHVVAIEKTSPETEIDVVVDAAAGAPCSINLTP